MLAPRAGRDKGFVEHVVAPGGVDHLDQLVALIELAQSAQAVVHEGLAHEHGGLTRGQRARQIIERLDESQEFTHTRRGQWAIIT